MCYRATVAHSGGRLLIEAWRELLERHAAVSAALERALHQRHDLGLSEFEVLDRLAEVSKELSKEQCRVQELVESGYLSQSALSRVISRLERAGLVERALCEFDRRGVYVRLTDAGRDRREAARATYLDVLAETLPVTQPPALLPEG